MIRSMLFSTILLVGFAFAQSAWLGGVAVLGVVPDLPLVALIWISYMNGPVVGPTVGFLEGLVEDFTTAAPLGFHAFIRTVVGTLASLMHGSFFIDRFLLPVVLGALGTIVKALAASFLALFFGAAVHSYSFLERMIWIEAAYNGLIAPFVFLLLSPLRRALAPQRGRS
ncbi:MAG TPA: rod shape-determining protein MreD [Rectinemataceae bacterium]|nr:rod shape-determining protein MreD [Rectinemataceae bacterium]